MADNPLSQSKVNTTLLSLIGGFMTLVLTAIGIMAWSALGDIRSHGNTLAGLVVKVDSIAETAVSVKTDLSHAQEKADTNQKNLWDKLMPRAEMEVMQAKTQKDIEALKADNNQMHLDIIKLQIEMSGKK